MPAAFLKGQSSLGHGGFPPRVATTGSSNVFVEGKAQHLNGGTWPTHTDGSTTHDTVTVVNNNTTVFANGQLKATTGDSVACGDTLGPGSSTYFIG